MASHPTLDGLKRFGNGRMRVARPPQCMLAGLMRAPPPAAATGTPFDTFERAEWARLRGEATLPAMPITNGMRSGRRPRNARAAAPVCFAGAGASRA